MGISQIGIWKSLEEAIRDLLSNITLADLAQRQRDLAEQAVVQD